MRFLHPSLRRYYSQLLLKEGESLIDAPTRFSPQFLKGRNNIGCSRLPSALLLATQKLLVGYPRSLLHRALYSLKSRLDTPIPPANPNLTNLGKSVISNPLGFSKWEWSESEVMVHVVTEMPKSVAVVERILVQDMAQQGRVVRGVWDFGSGVGSVKWAAREVFPGIYVKEEDVSARMQKINKELINEEDAKTVGDVNLSTAVFSLGELIDEEAIRLALDQMYENTSEYALVVDHGSPQGFERVMYARDHFISKGMNILAPCLHLKPCPLARGKEVCSFKQRLENPPLMNELRSSSNKAGYTDVFFSYVLASKHRAADVVGEWEGRIVRKGLKKSGHVVNDLCTEEGKLMRYVNTRVQGKQVYYDARKSTLGDLWPHPSKARPVEKSIDNDNQKTDNEAIN